MTEPKREEMPSAWPGAAFLAVVYLLSTAWGFWLQPIVNPDEPRYACAARDIVEGHGRWLVPKFNGEPRLKKPPLIYWALATCGKIGTSAGLGLEASFRIASLLAGLVAILSVYGLGRRLLNPRAGLLTGLILIGMPFVHSQWREIDTDPFLAAALTGTWYFFVAALQRIRPPNTGSPWAWMLGACLCMALACLAKGPFLLTIFFLLPAGVYLLWSQSAEERGGRIFLRLGFHWALPLALLIGLGWNIFLSEHRATQSGTQELLDQNIRRFLGGIDHNKGLQMYPWLQYLINVPQQSLPWSLFWLPLLVLAWREHRSRLQTCLLALAMLVLPALALRLIGGPTPEKSWQLGPYRAIAGVLVAWTIFTAICWGRRIGPLSDRAKLLVCAVAIPFLFMGLAGSKRESYLLPIFPFLAVWTAQAWDWVLSQAECTDLKCRWLTRTWTAIVGLLAVISAILPFGLALSGPLKIQTRVGFELAPGIVVVAVLAGIAMTLAAVWTLLELRAGRWSRAAVQAGVLVAAALFVHEATLRPALDRREDRGAFYAEVRNAVGSRPLVWFGGTANEAVYYCRHTVKRLLAFSEMEDGFFATSDAVMVVRDKEYDSQVEPAPSLRAALRQLRRLTLGDKVFYVVEADPAHAPLPAALKGKPAAGDGSEDGG